MPAEFVHLHVHTQFSFLGSTVKLPSLVSRAAELKMPAVAVTDHANMFGAIRLYTACEYAGIQPILGAELNISRGEGGKKTDHLVVLAATTEGYHNLVKLVTRSHLHSSLDDTPAISLEQLAQASQGLIGLTACMNGVVNQRILEVGPDQARPWLVTLRDIFDPGSLFVELQEHGLPEQAVLNRILCENADALGLPVVATNDVHFLKRDDGEAHLILECIRRNRPADEERRLHHGSFEMYLKTAEEMSDLFSHRPDAVKNTMRIAEMCSGVKLKLGKPMLPKFPLPEGYDVASYFRHVSQEGLESRFKEFETQGRTVDRDAYRARLELELDVIVGMDFPGYFLIVWDFIREARVRGVPVGPGRGSGAGSIVAYSLGITQLDPIPYNLLFERFLNPERISMPDFDVDFCMSRREVVIQYVSEKYGHESVGQIATYQNLKAKSVVKDVGRTLRMAATETQRIANLIPDLGQGKTATIAEALEQEPKLKELVDTDPRVAELIRYAGKLEGLTRHAGMHAAGVVIADGPLEDFVPCFENDGSTITQYDKDDVEKAGLVKFDFLGLKTLTTIDIAEKLVNARPDRRGRPLKLSDLPPDDPETYGLIASGDTKGVFQLESTGMQNTVLKPLRPDCFEDIVAAVALYRPGPLSTGMVDDFIKVKHGKKERRRLHPLVDHVLEPTYGVPVYQEQVMQIAQHLAGYSLGGADLLRRAMGKKKASEMEKQRKTFVEGALSRGVSEEQALAIFQEVEGFASYGFNKSHSAAYALVTFHTAYLKRHYPAEFFAAVMTSDKDKIEKVVRTIAEARDWGVSVLPPDINASIIDFSVVYAHPDGSGPRRGPGKMADRFGPQIRFGLGAVRGVGESALEAVFEARDSGGPFRDLFDFAARVDAKRLNRGLMESLIHCGAFDTVLRPVGVSRAEAFASIERVLERARSASRDRAAGQTTLFGQFQASTPATSATEDYVDHPGWDQHELLRRERGALGCYVSGHPLERYGAKLTRLGALPVEEIGAQDAWSAAAVVGTIEGYEVRTFRNGGGRAAFFNIEDRTGRVAARLRGERIDEFEALLKNGEAVLARGKVQFRVTEDEENQEREPTLLVDALEGLAATVMAATRSVLLQVDARLATPKALERLREALRAFPGDRPVELCLQLPKGAEVGLQLDGLSIEPSDALLAEVEKIWGGGVAILH